MRFRPVIALVAIALVVAACSDSESADTTAAPTTSTTTTTTLVPTTTVPDSTTSEATTTSTTEPDGTTTTSEAVEETTTTTTRVEATTSTTAAPPEDADPDLVPYAGLYRQPTVFDGYLDFVATGVIRAGTDPSNLTINGRWDYDEDTDYFTFSDFDFGPGCDGADGVYQRERAPGGGRRIILIEDPCQERADFIVQPDSECMCFLYNVAQLPEDDA